MDLLQASLRRQRRARVCRPTQATVRSKPPSARDKQDWRVHPR